MNDKDAKLISEAYGKVLVNEISQEWVDKVMSHIGNPYIKGNLPFDNIFGKDLRIVLGKNVSNIYSNILKDLKSLPDFSGIDPQTKEVLRKIKLDPRFSKGEDVKIQKINLGKAISSLKIDPEKKKKYLNWYANFNQDIPEMKEKNKYSIVLSRYPVDVLRMSDMGTIRSCHSQGNTYFHCAIQEAKTGGAIAYLVETEDLDENLDELQFPDFFKDKERSNGFITPLSRIRIRRYFNPSSGEAIAIPEVRVYGKHVSNFYEDVKNFLKEKQNLNFENILSQYKNRELIKTGGSYADSSDSELFNDFFDTDEFRGSLEHEENDEKSQSRRDQFETELQEFKDNHEFNHCNTWFEVVGDDEYVYYDAGAKMIISPFELEESDYFPDFQDSENFRDYLNYEEGDSLIIARYSSSQTEEEDIKDEIFKFQRFIIAFKKELKKEMVKVDVDLISDMGFNNGLYLDFCFGDDCYGTSTNTDDYRWFLSQVSNYEKYYEEVKKCSYRAYISAGYVNINDLDKKFLDKYLSDEETEEKKQKRWEEKERKITNLEDNIVLFSIPYVHSVDSVGNVNRDRFISYLFNAKDSINKKELENKIINYIDKNFKPIQPNGQQTTFKSFYESTQNKTGDYSVDCELRLGSGFSYDVILNFKYNSLKEHDDISYQRIKFVSGNMKVIKQMMTHYVSSKMYEYLKANHGDMLLSFKPAQKERGYNTPDKLTEPFYKNL